MPCPPEPGHFGVPGGAAAAAYSNTMTLRFRLLAAPWWLRALIASILTAVLVIVLAGLLMPGVSRIGWPWQAALLTVVSLTFGAVFAVGGQPLHRAFLASTAGLSGAGRAQAVIALRSGQAPADPAVLAAALALAAMFEQRRGKRAARMPLLTVLAVTWLTGLGVLNLVQDQPRIGFLWLLIAVLNAGSFVLDRHRRKRLLRNISALRADAAGRPGGQELIAVAGHQPALIPSRRQRAAIVLVVLVVVAGASWATVELSRPSPDCRVARDVVGYVYDRRELLDPNTIPAAAGHPPLTAYQQWSDQLQRHAGAVSSPEIAPRLHSIAEQAAQAVTLVLNLRTRELTPSTVRQRGDMGLYSGIANQITADENALLDQCRLR
jgi:hypothetical protein